MLAKHPLRVLTSLLALLCSGVLLATPAQADESQRDKVVAYVVQQFTEGKPYVWGAKGPDAFDCSGLMFAAYQQIGIDIAPSTHSYDSNPNLFRIEASEILPGDIAFNHGHVAMYVGGDPVGIGAQSPSSSPNIRRDTMESLMADNIVAWYRVKGVSDEFNGTGGANQPTPDDTNEAMGIKGAEGARTDYELLGMPARWTPEQGANIALPDSSTLTAGESVNLQGWASSNELQTRFDTGHLVRSGVMFVGLLLMLYGVVLMFAVGLEITVPGVSGSVLKTVTGGKYQFSSEAPSSVVQTKKSVRVVGLRQATFLIISVITLGAIIISGSLSGWLAQFIYHHMG